MASVTGFGVSTGYDMCMNIAQPKKRTLVTVGLSALLAGSVLIAPGNSNNDKKPCNPRKTECPVTTTTSSSSTTSFTSSTTTTSTTTTTTTSPTSSTTISSTTSTTAPSGSTAPDTQGTWVSPEGVTIDVNTAGSFTIRDIYRLLLENSATPGDLSRVGPTLTIRVQDTYASSTSTTAVGMPGAYTSVRSTMYLKGVSSTFTTRPDMQFAHEYGHAWSMFHLYFGDGGDWNKYLGARELLGDTRLDSTYAWSRHEIIADDYRLLFGSAAAVAQAPSHMNWEIPHPADVAGLREYLLGAFRTP